MHFFQKAALSLGLKKNFDAVRPAKLHVGIRIEALGPNVFHRDSRLQSLVGIKRKIHINCMNFRSMALIHRPQIRVATYFDLLQLLLLIQNSAQAVTAHYILVLLGGCTSGESQTHGRLIEGCLR